MIIKKIHIKNFKSFRDLEIDFSNFNVLIGANASGKSNFVQIFEFLRDISESGLKNAVSMQGGTEYLRNINIDTSNNMSIKVVSDIQFRWVAKHTKKEIIGAKTHEITYEFALKFSKRGSKFRIIEDKLTQKMNFVRLARKNKELEEEEMLGEGLFTIQNANGKAKISLQKPEKVSISRSDIYHQFFIEREPPSNSLLIETPYFIFPPMAVIFRSFAIYDFDPKLPKKATPITGKAELEEDGNNLSIILKNIAEDKERKRKLFNLVNDILPFVGDLDVEKFADKSLLFKLKETYFENQYLPASFISDGTINITALVVALYFEKKQLTIIEEPERNIHAYLISKVVDMMKDASRNKQIIITTHSPEIVKHAGLENLLLVSRDKDGFTTISKPANKIELMAFLENKIGIEELYVQNLLGA